MVGCSACFVFLANSSFLQTPRKEIYIQIFDVNCCVLKTCSMNTHFLGHFDHVIYIETLSPIAVYMQNLVYRYIVRSAS